MVKEVKADRVETHPTFGYVYWIDGKRMSRHVAFDYLTEILNFENKEAIEFLKDLLEGSLLLKV